MHSKLRLALLPMALSMALAAGQAMAQSTTGSLSGQAPKGATTVVVKSDSGLTREVAVDSRGRYVIQQLPLGTYTVTAMQGDQAVGVRDDVSLKVGTTTDVSFADVKSLDSVNVTLDRATAAIDVSSVDSRTVVTAEQLRELPLGRSAEDIAKLAPGVVVNASNGNYSGPTGQQLVSFGGSSVAENAYYINGFNTTDPLKNLGGLSLPYGSIDQMEVYTGGYSAKYGRSDGGVINAVGKRGTNEWHFGGQVTWEPASTRASRRNTYYPATGELYSPDSQDSYWTTTKSIYAGGPIIKDKLFFFGAYDIQKQEGDSHNSVESSNPDYLWESKRPSWYAKLDWNISDNHLLEVTGASSRYKTSGAYYDYDYDTFERKDFKGYADSTESGGDIWNVKYTGYLTDRLTASAMYGKMYTVDYIGAPGYDSSYTFIDSASYQNPAYNGGTPIRGQQTIDEIYDPGRGNRTENLRLDLNYVIGRHNITVGIDNQEARAVNQGSRLSGPGYYWSYGKSDPSIPIVSGLGVPATEDYPNGEEGYYVEKYTYGRQLSVKSKQTAQYIEDNWQVTDTLMLSLGLRLDQFTNYNANGDAYIKQDSGQWAPRLGFSWDVDGDGSFKVFGNAGRYYLALPLNPGTNAAAATVSYSDYYTYGGIDANGEPTDLTHIAGPVSSNNNFGILPDPKTVAVQDIKPSYQDEFILGFSKAWGDSWVYGAKATYRVLRSGVDDYCDIDTVLDKASSLGYDVTYDSNPVSCWLINPGVANTFTLVDTSGQYVSVKLSNDDMGMPQFKRKYYALNGVLEHPFDGRWYAKFDYTFSRSYGTSEGQTYSIGGQTAIATTRDWDFAQLMENTNGPQANDHTHQFKAFGYFQINPQWLVSANLTAISGAPRLVVGSYSGYTDPAGYSTYYHFYKGQPAPPGSMGRLPWMKQLDIGVTYKPSFADGKLKFGLDVFNVFNSETALFMYPRSEIKPGVENPLFGAATVRQKPRYLRFSVTYDY